MCAAALGVWRGVVQGAERRRSRVRLFAARSARRTVARALLVWAVAVAAGA